MGIDNASIAFWTSWLYLPWVVKMLWGPLVDLYSTKRKWILSTQLAMAICLFSAAYALNTEGYFFFSLLAFAAGAFVSATHDIAADGFYMLALSKESQALFVGIRATFYRLAMIFGSGLLVYTAGRIEALTGSIPLSWTVVIGASGFVFVLVPLYHTFALPFPATDIKCSPREAASDVPFLEIFRSYFKQEKIGAIIAFILLYRFAEAMLLKLARLFTGYQRHGRPGTFHHTGRARVRHSRNGLSRCGRNPRRMAHIKVRAQKVHLAHGNYTPLP